jgi:hypothetical protein
MESRSSPFELVKNKINKIMLFNRLFNLKKHKQQLKQIPHNKITILLFKDRLT